VSDDRPPGRPVSHRAETPQRSTAQRLLPPLAAVAVVVMVIVLLLALNSRPSPNAGPALISPTPTVSTPPTVPPTTTVPTTAPPTTAAPTTQPATARTAPVLPVTVLNNSRESGLAHRVAREVEAHGWPVARVGNFTGRLAESTLYYAHGQLASARRLARELPAIKRIRLRFSGLPGSGLTLVVTRDWPS